MCPLRSFTVLWAENGRGRKVHGAAPRWCWTSLMTQTISKWFFMAPNMNSWTSTVDQLVSAKSVEQQCQWSRALDTWGPHGGEVWCWRQVFGAPQELGGSFGYAVFGTLFYATFQRSKWFPWKIEGVWVIASCNTLMRCSAFLDLFFLSSYYGHHCYFVIFD